ncbi:MAG: hypothetical protein COX57_05410 [Alphaproteobacteria bacterium CG_4_10_14_0_2_um_filter_63_37]|nr:MAG: hypothetical protein AUJ55_12330 [Proteobacteria bacterium CG1_02_64_396]PJA25000.1 MAG: hypothetical protein COX57_05410 [Alphaproteobacteria bacterium CG_4_10_14_0_2_um_filter_63_37]
MRVEFGQTFPLSKWCYGVLLALGVVLFGAGPLAKGLGIPGWILVPLYALALTFLLMPGMIALALGSGAIDHPGERRIHETPIPRLGGIAIIAGTFGSLLFNFDFTDPFKGVVLAAGLVAAVSVLDDLHSLSAGLRLGVQVGASMILVHYGVRLEFMGGGPVGWWIEAVVTILWVIGAANAFNFLDGMNGLAGGLGVIASGLLALVAYQGGQSDMVLLATALLGACLGFLPYNARYDKPALTFMGDGGSIFIGYMLAALCVMGDWAEGDRLRAYLPPLLILALPLFDILYTTVSRIHRNLIHNFHEWIAYTGQDHLHHRVNALGFSRLATVGIIWLMALALGLGALLAKSASHAALYLILIQSGLMLILIVLLMRRGAYLQKELRLTREHNHNHHDEDEA